MDTETQEKEMQTKAQQEMDARMATYRAQVRETFGQMSDEALVFQNSIIVGGIDAEEVERELNRRRG
jgi:hypothetical protein